MLFGRLFAKPQVPPKGKALPGRDKEMPVPERHLALGTPLKGPFPAGLKEATFGMGCFWGAERLFWQTPGVYTTAAGYAGGETPNPNYDETCSGATGHAEVVRVVYDPNKISYADLLRIFWENHDPTQGMRQGNDVGTQYRSAIYTHSSEQRRLAEETKAVYEDALKLQGRGPVTTEIAEAGPFYYAEDHHQQYLERNPDGYCGLRGTGVSCPMPDAK